MNYKAQEIELTRKRKELVILKTEIQKVEGRNILRQKKRLELKNMKEERKKESKREREEEEEEEEELGWDLSFQD